MQELFCRGSFAFLKGITMKFRNICASVLLTGVVLVSGCGSSGCGTKHESNFAYPSDYTRVPMVTDAVIKESSEAGNSGEVKLESGDTYAIICIKNYGDIKVKLYPDLAPYAVQNFIDLALDGTYEGRTFHRIIEDFMAQGGSADGRGSGGDSYEGGAFRNEINTSLRHYYGALCYASAMGDMSDQFYIVNNKESQDDLSGLYDQYSEYYEYMSDQYDSLRDQYEGNETALSNIDMYVNFYTDSADGAAAMKNTITDAVTEKYKNGGTPSLDGGYTVFGHMVEGFEVLDAITAVAKEEGSDGAQSKPVNDVIIESVTIHVAE